MNTLWKTRVYHYEYLYILEEIRLPREQVSCNILYTLSILFQKQQEKVSLSPNIAFIKVRGWCQHTFCLNTTTLHKLPSAIAGTCNRILYAVLPSQRSKSRCQNICRSNSINCSVAFFKPATLCPDVMDTNSHTSWLAQFTCTVSKPAENYEVKTQHICSLSNWRRPCSVIKIKSVLLTKITRTKT